MKSEYFVWDFINKGTNHRYFNRQFVGSLSDLGLKVLIQPPSYASDVYDDDETHPGRGYLVVSDLVCRWFYFFFVSLKSRDSKHFILAIDNTIGPLLLLLSRLVTIGSVICILHNNYSRIQTSRSRRFLFRCLSRSGVVFLVMREQLCSELRTQGINARYLRHPLPEPGFIFSPDNRQGIVVVGRANDLEVNTFPEVYNLLTKVPNIVVKVLKSSPLHKSLVAKNDVKLSFDVYERPISEVDYFKLLSESDAVLLPSIYDERRTASGVLMDAISTETPVISSSLGICLEYLDKSYPGFIFDEGSLNIDDGDFDLLLRGAASHIKNVRDALARHQSSQLKELLSSI